MLLKTQNLMTALLAQTYDTWLGALEQGLKDMMNDRNAVSNALDGGALIPADGLATADKASTDMMKKYLTASLLPSVWTSGLDGTYPIYLHLILLMLICLIATVITIMWVLPFVVHSGSGSSNPTVAIPMACRRKALDATASSLSSTSKSRATPSAAVLKWPAWEISRSPL